MTDAERALLLAKENQKLHEQVNRQSKVLRILKGLLFVAHDDNHGLSYLEVDQINELNEHFKTIEEWLKGE